jgi:hypothetical protein
MAEHRPAPELKDRAEELVGRGLDRVRLVTDTSEFMEIAQGDILEVEGRRLVVKGVAYEGRFGLDDEPKHWVKRAVDWETGEPAIVKLVFYERFDLPIGELKVRCYRSPAKEARVLEATAGHPHFMHGATLRDEADNLVRVLEVIRGRPFEHGLARLGADHEEYVERHLAGVLERLIPAFRGIGELHRQGLRHGDIRRDHLLDCQDSGLLRWIDFDYNFEFKENPFGLDLFGLGNVLCHAVGRGIPTLPELKRERPEALERLDTGDLSLVIPNRVFNLKKVHPHLPEGLNRVLMHFAAAATVFYERVEELLADLEEAAADLGRPARPQRGGEEEP